MLFMLLTLLLSADDDDGVVLLNVMSGNEKSVDCDLTYDSTDRRMDTDGNRSSPSTVLGSLKIKTAMQNAHRCDSCVLIIVSSSRFDF